MGLSSENLTFSLVRMTGNQGPSQPSRGMPHTHTHRGTPRHLSLTAKCAGSKLKPKLAQPAVLNTRHSIVVILLALSPGRQNLRLSCLL